MKNNPDVLNPAEALQTKSSSLGKASKKKMDVAAKHPFVHRPKITSIDKVQVCSLFCRSLRPVQSVKCMHIYVNNLVYLVMG